MKNYLFLLASLVLTTAGTAHAQAPVKTTGSVANENARHRNLSAQNRKTPAQKADRKASKMAKALGLNGDQEARIEQLMLARQQESAALKAKYGTDKKAGRADLQAARNRYQAQLKTILTAEQYAKFNQMKEEHRGPGKAKAKA